MSHCFLDHANIHAVFDCVCSKGVAEAVEGDELPPVGHAFIETELVNDPPEGLRYPLDLLASPVLKDQLVG